MIKMYLRPSGSSSDQIDIYRKNSTKIEVIIQTVNRFKSRTEGISSFWWWTRARER